MKAGRKYILSEEQIGRAIRLRNDEAMSFADIGYSLGCSSRTVSRELQKRFGA